MVFESLTLYLTKLEKPSIIVMVIIKTANNIYKISSRYTWV